jgi:hypothetical protein
VVIEFSHGNKVLTVSCCRNQFLLNEFFRLFNSIRIRTIDSEDGTRLLLYCTGTDCSRRASILFSDSRTASKRQ